MEKETIEEASERLVPGNNRKFGRDLFIQGAKWQAEKMYSCEEVIELLEHVRKNYYDTGKVWHQEPDKDFTSKEIVEQFKKQKNEN